MVQTGSSKVETRLSMVQTWSSKVETRSSLRFRLGRVIFSLMVE